MSDLRERNVDRVSPRERFVGNVAEPVIEDCAAPVLRKAPAYRGHLRERNVDSVSPRECFH
jgi:hypothetical protein